MRGRILFACFFTVSLWLLLHAFCQAQDARAGLPAPVRAAAETAAPAPAEEDAPAPAPRAVRAQAEAPLPQPARRVAPALPDRPYYRLAWQAFHLQGEAG